MRTLASQFHVLVTYNRPALSFRLISVWRSFGVKITEGSNDIPTYLLRAFFQRTLLCKYRHERLILSPCFESVSSVNARGAAVPDNSLDTCNVCAGYHSLSRVTNPELGRA